MQQKHRQKPLKLVINNLVVRPIYKILMSLTCQKKQMTPSQHTTEPEAWEENPETINVKPTPWPLVHFSFIFTDAFYACI